MAHPKSKKTKIISLLVILFALLMVRMAAPSIATWYVNRTIEKTQSIEGAVGGVELAIFAGAYSINNINIRQAGDSQEFPLFMAEKMSISLLWSALFKGKLVAELTLTKPTIGLYDRPKDKVFEDPAITDEKTWLGLANNLTPFSINTLTVENGTFVMDAQSKLKRSEFRLSNIQLLLTNIANIKGQNTEASVNMTGDIQNQAKLTLTGTFDPNTIKPNFDLNLEMAKLPVSYVDALMKFYAPFDFEAGEIDMASEIKSQQGNVTGYVKVGIYHLDIFSWHEDVVEDDTNPIDLGIEMLGGMLATLFENDNKELVATRVPIEGNIDSPDISNWEAFVGILRNAFIQAYSLKVEGSVGDDNSTSKASG